MTKDLKSFILETAKDAGKLVKASYGKIKTWQTKTGPGDIVTEVDFQSEKLIIDRIQQAFPNDNIMSEEAGKILAPTIEEAVEEGRTWFIDPIDGTRNFALGIPFFCVSIGVAEKGVVTHGVVYDPVHDDIYYAEKGMGTTVNDHPVSVSEKRDWEDALVSISWSRRVTDYREFLDYITKVSPHSSEFRRLGSAAMVLCYIASGKFDMYMQRGISAWDIAAGILLVEEAGGKATDFCGKPIDLAKPGKLEILAANPTLHELAVEQVCRREGGDGGE